jgi:hypothetical protein
VRSLGRIIVVPVMLLTIGACEERNGPVSINKDCGPLGPSSGTVTGVVNADLNGCSVFTVATGAGGTVTTIGLSHGSGISATHALSLGRTSGRPAVGTYSIGTGTGDFNGAFTFDGGSGSDRLFMLTAGTVTISASSATALTGTLSGVTAAESSTPANTISITASFSARCTATSSTSC